MRTFLPHALLTPLAVLQVLTGQSDPEPLLALGGLDPVALCLGEEKAGVDSIVETRGRYRYRFATAASAAKFRSDPGRWCIQWGGGCGRMGPLSGRGDPGRFAVHRQRIYIFASDGCRTGFLADPDRFAGAGPAVDADPDAASLAKGRQWIDRAVAAHGGAKAIDAPAAVRLTRAAAQGEWKSDERMWITRGGAVSRRVLWFHSDPKERRYDTRWVGEGSTGFVVESGRTFDLSSSEEQADLRRFAHREPITLLWRRKADSFRAEYRGRRDHAGRDAVEVRVRCDGLSTSLYLDPDDSRILGMSWSGRISDGTTRQVVETFTQWREVGGVRVPVGRTVQIDGEAKPVAGWDGVDLLEASPRGDFARPGAGPEGRAPKAP